MYIRLVLSHSYLYRTEEQFEVYKNESQILIAGDSHPMSAVNPQYLPGSFNLTSTGENIVETYYRLQYYLDEEQLDIKLVILPIDLHSFSSYRLDRFRSPDFWRKYIDYVELGRFQGDVPKYVRLMLLGEISFFNDVTNTIDLMKIRAGVIEGNYALIKGFMARTESFIETPEKNELAKNRVNRHLNNAIPFDGTAQVYLIRTLELLDEHKVDTILVRFPVTKEYYYYAQTRMDTPSFYQDLQELLQESSLEPPILDYHDLFWDKEQYFADIDHLNVPGARIFTSILQRDLQESGYLP
jgi:hypothetical protein